MVHEEYFIVKEWFFLCNLNRKPFFSKSTINNTKPLYKDKIGSGFELFSLQKARSFFTQLIQ
jgi:hypothetical protein